MRKLISLAVMALFTIGAFAQTETKKEEVKGPGISFDKMVHDYGDVVKGGDGESTFTFTNTGTEPLILSAVRSSCGCTTPFWTSEPVMPGKTGEIKVRYNTNSVGTINKSVTVSSNAVNSPSTILRITGKVTE